MDAIQSADGYRRCPSAASSPHRGTTQLHPGLSGADSSSAVTVSTYEPMFRWDTRKPGEDQDARHRLADLPEVRDAYAQLRTQRSDSRPVCRMPRSIPRPWRTRPPDRRRNDALPVAIRLVTTRLRQSRQLRQSPGGAAANGADSLANSSTDCPPAAKALRRE